MRLASAVKKRGKKKNKTEEQCTRYKKMRGKKEKEKGGQKYVSADGCAKLCSVSNYDLGNLVKKYFTPK